MKPGGIPQQLLSPEELQDSILQFLQPDWKCLKSYLDMLKNQTGNTDGVSEGKCEFQD